MRPGLRLVLVHAAHVGLPACGGATASAPVAATYVVEVPAPQDEPPPAVTDPAVASGAPAPCPPDAVQDHGTCLRILPSPEIPAWQPPAGHGDPCATWTSEKGLLDCDSENEFARDAGPASKRAERAPALRR